MNETTTERPLNTYVDSTPAGHVALIHIAADDSMDSTVIYLTPAVAAKLGQRLIDVANRLEPTP